MMHSIPVVELKQTGQYFHSVLQQERRRIRRRKTISPFFSHSASSSTSYFSVSKKEEVNKKWGNYFLLAFSIELDGWLAGWHGYRNFLTPPQTKQTNRQTRSVSDPNLISPNKRKKCATRSWSLVSIIMSLFPKRSSFCLEINIFFPGSRKSNHLCLIKRI